MKVWSESWGDLKPSNVFLTEDWLLRAASHKHNEKTIAHMFAFSCLLSSTRVDNWGGIPQIVRIVPHYLSLRPLLKGFAIRATGWFWHLQESKIHCQLVPNSRRYAGRPGSFALGPEYCQQWTFIKWRQKRAKMDGNSELSDICFSTVRLEWQLMCIDIRFTRNQLWCLGPVCLLHTFWTAWPCLACFQAYMSPELTRMQKYGPKTEVWSLGATLYEMRLSSKAKFCVFLVAWQYISIHLDIYVDFPGVSLQQTEFHKNPPNRSWLILKLFWFKSKLYVARLFLVFVKTPGVEIAPSHWECIFTSN